MRFLFDRSPVCPKLQSARRCSRVVLSAVGVEGATQGWLVCGGQKYPCAFGKSGIGVKKREGDAITPMGVFLLRAALLTRLAFSPPMSRLPVLRTSARAGWCDDVGHPRRYNRAVALPTRMSHEVLRREDGLYDLLLVLGYNDAPVRGGRGSAIFLHATATTNPSPPYAPTEGCIAIAAGALRGLLPKLRRGAAIRIGIRKMMDAKQTRVCDAR